MNTTVVISWFNMIKILELIYQESTGKYVAHKDAKKNIFLDNIFISGSSLFEVEGLKSKFISMQYDFG